METVTVSESKGKRADLLKKLLSTASEQKRWTEFMSARSKLEAAIWEAEQLSCLGTCRELLATMPLHIAHDSDCETGKHTIPIGVIRGTAVFSESETVSSCFQQALAELAAADKRKHFEFLSVSLSANDFTSSKTAIGALIGRIVDSVNDADAEEASSGSQLLVEARRRQCLLRFAQWFAQWATVRNKSYTLFVVLDNADRFSASALRELIRALFGFLDAVCAALQIDSHVTFSVAITLLVGSPLVSPCSLLPSDVLPRCGCLVELRAAPLASLLNACFKSDLSASVDFDARVASWSLAGFATRAHLAAWQRTFGTTHSAERPVHRYGASKSRIISRLRINFGGASDAEADESATCELGDVLATLRRDCTPLVDVISVLCATELDKIDRNVVSTLLFRLAELEYIGAIKMRRAHMAAQTGSASVELLL